MLIRNPRYQQGVTFIEVLIVAVIAGLLIVGLNGIVGQALQSKQQTESRNQLSRDANFALQRMIQALSHTRLLLLPFPDKPSTNDTENIREQTDPSSLKTDTNALDTAVLAMTLPAYVDLNADGVADADNDGDGRFDEDLPADSTNDDAPGIRGIDDDDDGWLDGWFVKENDDEEFYVRDEDPINGNDDDGDGSIDEDPPADMNADGCPGDCYVDDDGDGAVDEGDVADDDEDGSTNEDWYDPLVFYFNNGTLIERTPVPWDESGNGSITGQDYVTSVIAEHVRRFRVERIAQGTDPGLRVDILLELHDPETGETASLRTQVLVGGAL
jgi:prepilin-type N-terminal cleavage/methylation domain-containing protein